MSRRPRKKAGPKRVDFGDSELVYEEDSGAGDYDDPGAVEFRPGDRVFHANYGEGVVRRLEEKGERTKLVVRFSQGTKKFLAKFAALEKIM